ncbi:hypothetical protein [Bdellovibrio sp. HCB288]|uniref:portal protein n=1 Tax=Bdellovibrio sp. HCB288 TaxID=3394355 RepID=UPI0039B44A26
MIKTYWAAESPDNIAKEVMRKVEAYQEFVKTSGILTDLRASYDAFYADIEIQDLDESIKAVNINHYASYIRNIHNMVCSSRPAWEPQAINTDLESQADTTLAAGLLDYYMREKHIESDLTESALRALYLKEGWISLGWNATGGKAIGVNPETGDPIKEGDFKVGTHTLLDVARDFYRKDMKHNWYILREWENKFDLAARHPEKAGEIIKLTMSARDRVDYELSSAKMNTLTKEIDTDLIPVYTLLHDKTDALKTGRMTIVLNADIELFDGPLPYKRLLLFPITTGKQHETAFGHSYPMDLLPIQSAFNMTVSSILTNQAANAVQNFQIPKGASPNLSKVASGMNVWEYDPKAGKMETMDLLKTAPEVFNFAEFLINQGDLISNVSQIGRGNAPADMSGTAMALLQQQAIQSTSGLSTSHTVTLEDVGTGLIELLQTFAVEPRLALIAGKSKRYMMKEFTNKDLQGLGRVFVNRANPLTKTGAGRMEIANNLLQAPPPQAGSMIKTPEQYIGVLTTGNLEPLYQHENSQRMLIISENEDLIDGKEVVGILTDDDATHILEHESVLNSPEARANPKVTTATLNHIQWHINNAKAKPPEMAAMLKQQSFFQPPPPPIAGPQEVAGGDPSAVMNPIANDTPVVNLPSPAQPPNPNAFNQGVQ